MKKKNYLNVLSWKIKRKIVDPALWSFYFTLFPGGSKTPPASAGHYSICVTTFLFRFERFLQPLVKKLAYLFSGQEIIVIANGHYDLQAQEAYIRSLKAFLSGFPEVRLIYFMEPRGLSFLWNQAVVNSQYEKVFILNDDLDLSVHLRKEIEASPALDYPVVTNEGSWSQFMITKQAYRLIGPFDEGLKEIGGEDDDYLIRMRLLGLEDKKMAFRHIYGKRGARVKVNSYGKVPRDQEGGYSTYNTKYLETKWEKSLQPIEGGVFVRGFYWAERRADGQKAPSGGY